MSIDILNGDMTVIYCPDIIKPALSPSTLFEISYKDSTHFRKPNSVNRRPAAYTYTLLDHGSINGYHNRTTRLNTEYSLQTLCGFVILVISNLYTSSLLRVIQEKSTNAKVSESFPLTKPSHVSKSVYMLHPPVIKSKSCMN